MTYFFKKPFGENGDISQIPTNDQGDGNVSYEKGWPEGYELDPNVDPDEARNLSRTNFNGLFFNITSALQALQIYGCNPYISASDNDGTPYPYPEGGMCYYTDPATGEYGVYRSLQSNNTEVPSTNGITSSLWRREFDFSLDTLKSNRVTNCPLYYPQIPSYTVDSETNSIYVSVFAGTKVLMPNGFDNDQTYNNSIVQLVNTETVSFVFDNEQINKYFFLTSNNEVILLDTKNYNHNTSLEMVNNELNGITDYDVYYFDINLNKWQYRAAGSDTFVDSSFSMVCIGSFTGSSIDNIGFSYIDPLILTSKETLENKISSLQTVLEPAKYIILSNTPQGRQIMNINLPSTATPFCVNYGNIDANGDADLLSTQSVVFPNQKENKITLTSGTIKSAVSGNNYYIGGAPDVVTASNIENIFRSSGGACEVWFAYNYSSWQKRTIAEMTFNEPIELSTLGSVLQAQVYEYDYYFHRPGYEQYYAKTWFEINLYFDDNTMITLPDSKSFSGTNVWKTISYNLSSYANSGKKVIKIQINWWGYMYNHCYGSWQWWYEVRSYVKNVRIINTVNSIQYSSNQIDFKIGSNYYKQLSANSNAMLSAETGTITSSNKVFNNIWFQESLVEIPSYIDIFSSTFEFSETPDETSNARLVLRYLDEENNKILGGISINVEYWGGVTYNLVSELVLDRSQDLIYSIPDGKYLKKITVSASQMDYLSRVKIGRIQIYNNVSSSTLSSLAQYPAIQATAADTDRTTYTLMNADSLVTDTSGYLMMSQSGIYLLPGTNVIRKQKNRPTVNDDPQLTDGDVWLDYSKEPLIAYQYHNGKWEIFQDVPLGYVTIDEGIVSNLETYEYNQNGYNINTFTDISGALSGRDGRDGQNGKDGKNGAPGPQGPAGVGIPTGGTTGQILAKASNANYSTKWVNMISTALFDGGTAGQTLIKNSNNDLDFGWGTIEVLPMGGTAGQALVKNSSTNYDASWQSLHEIPNGGSTNQVLTKLSNSDQDVAWMNPSGGVSQASLNKMDFKTSMYFKASVDGYTNLLLEQFIGLDGVSTVDRTNVLTYFNAMDDVIENTSGETLTFRLVEMSFSQAINYMELEADYTGTVTFKYSIDSGTTYVNFPENQMLQVTVSTLILKIEMANGANLGNIAIFVK